MDIKVTNPITYIKSWWNKIIVNEGVELRLKIRPLTAIAISIIILTVTLGIGKFVLPFKVPFFVYTSKEDVESTTEKSTYRETAFTGTLRRTLLSNRFYLETGASEAINLEVPENIILKDFVGRRIFATGKYHEETRTLLVTEATDLEILPKEVETIPTVEITIPPEAEYIQEPTRSLIFE